MTNKTQADHISNYNKAQINTCLSEIATDAITLGRIPESKIDLAITWITGWNKSHAQNVLNSFKKELLALVADDIPHLYRNKLMEKLK